MDLHKFNQFYYLPKVDKNQYREHEIFLVDGLYFQFVPSLYLIQLPINLRLELKALVIKLILLHRE